MIAGVLRLTGWEWFKLRRRWMPWVLLGVAILIAQFSLWFSYTAYHNESLQEVASGGSASFTNTYEVDGQTVSVGVTCVDVAEGRLPPELDKLPDEERESFSAAMEQFGESCGGTLARDEFRQGFVFPTVLIENIDAAVGIGAILIMILAASALGSEYGWGTLRTALTRGAGRWQLLSSKLVLLILAGAAGLVVVSAFAAVSSLLAAVIPPAEEGGLTGPGRWSDVALTFVKAVYALAPYIALSTFLAVLTQSSAMGIALSVGYYVVELIVRPIVQVVDRLQSLSDFTIGGSVTNWMSFALVDVSSGVDSAAQPDALQSFLVILVYTAALGAAAFWLFLRRDVTGARGS